MKENKDEELRELIAEHDDDRPPFEGGRGDVGYHPGAAGRTSTWAIEVNAKRHNDGTLRGGWIVVEEGVPTFVPRATGSRRYSREPLDEAFGADVPIVATVPTHVSWINAQERKVRLGR